MKKNIETIKRTVVEEKITWIASDGTIFNDEKNCKEYEDTCKCKVKSLLANVECKRLNSVYGMYLPYSTEDHELKVYNIKSNSDVDALIMYLAFEKENERLYDYGDDCVYPSYDDVGEMYYILKNYDDEICYCGLVKTHIEKVNNCFKELLNTFKTITEEKGGGKDGD